MRPTCDFGDKHGKPVAQRWSWEWMLYFDLCAKCLKQWDQIGEHERFLLAMENR